VIVRPNVPEDGDIRPKHVVNVKTFGVSVPRIGRRKRRKYSLLCDQSSDGSETKPPT
jgi:hypothetical protein